MHKFYIDQPLASGTNICLTDKDECHHLKKVLRLKSGNIISVFNGQLEEGEAEILSLAKEGVQLSLKNIKKHNYNYPLVTLVCAIPKKGKFELIIEKVTELGVYDIIPMTTEHGDVKLKVFSPSKIKRYRTIALNAVKQSKRHSIPRIHAVSSFQEILKSLSVTHEIILAGLDGKRKPILHALSNFSSQKPIAVFIGPEGDFSTGEYEFARQNKVNVVCLGQNILRVETAAIAATALTQLFFHS